MPVVRMATFSTCPSAGARDPSSRIGSNRSGKGTFMVLLLSIPNCEGSPAPNHQDVQHDTDCENGFHSPRARGRRPMADEPRLVDQGADGDDEKERLQPLEHQQTARAQQGKYAKSSLDLREYSSTRCEQGGDDRQPSRPL